MHAEDIPGISLDIISLLPAENWKMSWSGIDATSPVIKSSKEEPRSRYFPALNTKN